MSDPADTPTPRPEDAETPLAEGAPSQAAAPQPDRAPAETAAPAAPSPAPQSEEPVEQPTPPQAAAQPQDIAPPQPAAQPQAAAQPQPAGAAVQQQYAAAPPQYPQQHGRPPLSQQELARQAAYYQQLSARPQMLPPNPRWDRPGLSASQPTVLIVAAVALFAAWAAFPGDGVGIGLALTGIALVAVPLATANPADLLPRLPGAVLVAALWSVAAFRDAGWVVALCALAAFGLTPLVLAPQRRTSGTLFTLFFAWLEGLAESFSWAKRGRRPKDGRSGTSMRGIWVALVTVGLLVVFGGLFAAADSTFADLVAKLLPELSPVEIILRLALAAILFPLVLLWAYTAVAKPSFDNAAPEGGGEREHRTVSRIELAIPLGALNLLFAAFIAVQLRVYLGGEGYVMKTAGLTFADYARRGFWQLSVVAVLSLCVIAIAARLAPKREKQDRWTVRALLGPLGVMSLVVIASALFRMFTYFETYGLTRLRVWVFTVEIWLAVLFALVLVCCWKLRATWLPQAVLASGALALLGLAAANPDALIARYNIDHDHKLDLFYLQGLSDDAVPEFAALSEEDRLCALDSYRDDSYRDDSDERDLMAWNLGYQRAEAFRAENKPGSEVDVCDDWYMSDYDSYGTSEDDSTATGETSEAEPTWSEPVVPPDSLFFTYDTCTQLDLDAADRLFGTSATGDYGVVEDSSAHGGSAFDPAEAGPGQPYGDLDCSFFGPGTSYLSIEVMAWSSDYEAEGFLATERAATDAPQDYTSDVAEAGFTSEEFKYMSVIGHLTFEVTVLDGGNVPEATDVAVDLAEVQLWEYYQTFA